LILLFGLVFLVIPNDVPGHDPCGSMMNVARSNEDKSLLESDLSELPSLMEVQVLRSVSPTTDHRFGYDLSLDGDTLAISASEWHDAVGYVELFRLEAGAWKPLTRLESPRAQLYESFNKVALHGDTLLVGAQGHCSGAPGSGCEEGIAYVFERNEGGADNWGLVQTLNGGFKRFARFANQVELGSDVAAVHAPSEIPLASQNNGVVYLYGRNPQAPGRWILTRQIESDDDWHIKSAYAGGVAHIWDDMLAVNGHDSSGMLMKIFERNEGGPGNWGLVQQISVPGMELHSGDFDAGTLLLHQQTDCVPSEEREHFLRFYERNDQNRWAIHQEISVPDGLHKLAMDSPLIVIGSENTAAGFVLQRNESTGIWEFTDRLVPSTPNIPFALSTSVALDAGNAVISDFRASENEGMALTYELATPINAGHAGAWANFDTLGQGQLIDVFSEQRYIFLAWFTYTTADSSDPFAQRWLTAQGNYVGNTAVLPLYETLGGAFDDSRPVETLPVGVVTLSFTGCGLGHMSYQFENEDLNGSFPIQRVIPGSGNLCESLSSNAPQSVDINTGMDGSWYSEDTPGQGFLLDVHQDSAGNNFMFVAWFTYGDVSSSGLRWLTAQGTFNGPTAVLELNETTGGVFDGPRGIDTEPVGTLTVDFTDCANARFDYDIPAEGRMGTIDTVRLLAGNEAVCEEITR
jgi:hypothetical protein